MIKFPEFLEIRDEIIALLPTDTEFGKVALRPE
jgi:hypothetical protein